MWIQREEEMGIDILPALRKSKQWLLRIAVEELEHFLITFMMVLALRPWPAACQSSHLSMFDTNLWYFREPELLATALGILVTFSVNSAKDISKNMSHKKSVK